MSKFWDLTKALTAEAASVAGGATKVVAGKIGERLPDSVTDTIAGIRDRALKLYDGNPHRISDEDRRQMAEYMIKHGYGKLDGSTDVTAFADIIREAHAFAQEDNGDTEAAA